MIPVNFLKWFGLVSSGGSKPRISLRSILVCALNINYNTAETYETKMAHTLLHGVDFSYRLPLQAQTVRVAGILSIWMPGYGINIKFGTDNEIWNFNGGLNARWLIGPEHGGFGPAKSVTLMYHTPYVEVSAYRIAAIGISPFSVSRGRFIVEIPYAILTISAPIDLWSNIALEPSVQAMFPLRHDPSLLYIPDLIIGLGVAVTIK